MSNRLADLRYGVGAHPVELFGASRAYRVTVRTDSMRPRYKHGEQVYVDLHMQPRPEDDVIIQMTDGRRFIREFVRRTDRSVVCKQYNPAQEIEFPAQDVKAVHLIVMVTKARI
jgi:phage repressor protein C with HTH and peptisase S24 domain